MKQGHQARQESLFTSNLHMYLKIKPRPPPFSETTRIKNPNDFVLLQKRHLTRFVS